MVNLKNINDKNFPLTKIYLINDSNKIIKISYILPMK